LTIGALKPLALLFSVGLFAACQSGLPAYFSASKSDNLDPADAGGAAPVPAEQPSPVDPNDGCDGGVDCGAASDDLCPSDPLKTEPGVCGCNLEDTASDEDDSFDCEEECPTDPLKTEPGACGCGRPDIDSDGDGVFDCDDECPEDADKTQPGDCGCGGTDVDGDEDGSADCEDDCPTDPGKTAVGDCGCGTADEDSDSDGELDCNDACPDDPNKTALGVCGCGAPEVDADADEVPDCSDECIGDDSNTDPSLCGCSVTNEDSDGDGVADCADECPEDPAKVSPGVCDCGTPDTDTDQDGTLDCTDACPEDPAKVSPGACDCGTPDTDTDQDGTLDCTDACPNDPDKTEPGLCGCDRPDEDTDDDGSCNDEDGCPDDAGKSNPGACGCNVPESDDSDGDGALDCVDPCANDPLKQDLGACGCDNPDTVGANGVVECENLGDYLVHRYMFDGTGTAATDSKGAAHGTLIGGTLSGDGTATLTNDVYVDLPNNVLSGLVDATIEVWFARSGDGWWMRLFDFGSNDGAAEGQQGTATSSLFYTPHVGSQSRLGFRPLGGAETTYIVGEPAPLDTLMYVAIVVDDTGNTIAVYKDGALAETMAWTGALSQVNAVNNWIGRSQYSPDPDLMAKVHEFRIHSRALDASATQYSYEAGPEPSFL
jgi:hypothetical protein